MDPPRRFIFAGLPGVGKSTLARLLARELRTAYVRVDSVEQAMREEGVPVDGGAGYAVAYHVAADNLRLGVPVVADSVNPLNVTRAAWRDVATHAGLPSVEIEVTCSDEVEHRRRVESRPVDVPGLRPPTWDDVRTRVRDPWETTPVVIDTAGQTESQSFAALRRRLEASK